MGLPPAAMLGGDAVPTQTPIATPPIVPGAQGDPSQQLNDKTKQLLQIIAQASQRKQMANTAVPGQVPQGGDVAGARRIGMDTANPNAWGTQRFLSTLGASIKSGVAKQKQDQLLKAEGDWNYLQSSLNELYQAQQSGDPQAIAAAQAKVDVTTHDPKKLKNMAKALNQDWLNPEKTTVYGEALKNVTKKSQQTEQQKAQAAQGIKGIFQKLIQKAQGPQLTPEQTQRMGQEIQAKAPTMQGATTPADLAKESEAVANLAYAQKTMRESPGKYKYIPSSDGTMWAVNEHDRNDAHVVRDAESGDPIKGKAAAKEGQAVMSAGVPIGIFHNGTPMLPGDPEWSEKDEKTLSAYKDAALEKQQLRIDPIIAAQLGAPPNPKEFAKGRSDPAYAAELAVYGKKAEKIKNEMAEAGGFARAKAYGEFRPVEVMDYDAEGKPITRYTFAKDAIEGGLSSATQGGRNLSRTAQIEDIEFASKKFKEVLENVDKPFNAKQIALLTEALKAPDESIASAEFQALANEQLTDSQFQATLWIKQINERAMSMRTIAGFGQGAQDMRDAIRGTLPFVGIGDKKRMLEAIVPFDNQVAILKKGIPKPGGGGAAGGTVKMKAPDGSVQAVPKDQVDHYKKLGATVVQQ